MNKHINQLIDTERELSRKDFLKFMAGGLIVLLGMSNFISYLTRYKQTGKVTVTHEASRGFGSRKFGA